MECKAFHTREAQMQIGRGIRELDPRGRNREFEERTLGTVKPRKLEPMAEASKLNERDALEDKWRRFIRTLLHQVINPLAGAKLQVELANMGAAPAEQALNEVSEGLNRIQRLVERTREYLKPPPAEPNTLLKPAGITDALSPLSSTFPGLLVIQDWHCFTGAQLSELLLKRIATECCRNAHQAQATHLILSREETSIYIEDDGNPFDEVAIQKALDPFYSRTPESVGLGLNIIQSGLEVYGGSLCLETSSSPKKARLRLRCPFQN